MGFGRVIERAKPEEPVQATKCPLTPDGQSSSSTTWRDVSDAHFTPGRVSPDEASLICHNVLSELALEIATVQVSSCSQGFITGAVEWGGMPSENVTFSILRIKQGYAVVGEVQSGPELFKKISWKLKAINGCCDVEPTWVAAGDVLMFEGPKWATQHLYQRTLRERSARDGAEYASAGGFDQLDASTHRSRCSNSSAIEGQPLWSGESPLGLGDPQDFGMVPAGRAIHRPSVPPLDLSGIHTKSQTRGPPKSVGMCLGPCQEEPSVSYQLNLPLRFRLLKALGFS